MPSETQRALRSLRSTVEAARSAFGKGEGIDAIARRGGGETGHLGGAILRLILDTRPQLPVLQGGQYVGHYRLREELGAGGFGSVWSAWDDQTHRLTALKLLPLPADDPHALEDVLSEVRASAAIRHPNVVAIRGTGVAPELRIAYIDMEISGDTDPETPQLVAVAAPLATWRQSNIPTYREAVRIALEASRGLAAAHALGVVHGDLSPSNVLISERGRVQITDFGLSRPASKTNQGQGARGTLAYLAPEQASGNAVLPVSDLYSLAGVLVFLITGTAPFTPREGETSKEFTLRVARVEGENAFPGDAPPVLSRIYQKARMPEPGRRYLSAGDFASDLDAYLRYEDPPHVGLVGARERVACWLMRDDRLRHAGNVGVAALTVSALFHGGSFFALLCDWLLGTSIFGAYGPGGLDRIELFALTGGFFALSSYGTLISSQLRVGKLAVIVKVLMIYSFFMGWIVSVLMGWFEFDAGGLLRDPFALRTMYTFFLAFSIILSSSALIGLASHILKRIDASRKPT